MIYAYCVRRAGEPGPPLDLRGLAEKPVRPIEEAGLGFWISESPCLPPTPERLRDHDLVVRAALRSATPLPVRYGTGCFASEEAAREALRSRAEELGPALDRVSGRVEMGVRLEWTPPEPGPPSRAERATPASAAAGGGRAYLEARRMEMERGDSLRSAAAAALDRLERELALEDAPSARTVLPNPDVAGILAHLVLTSRVHRYRECVEKAAKAMPEYRLVVSGPWAPYSFS